MQFVQVFELITDIYITSHSWNKIVLACCRTTSIQEGVLRYIHLLHGNAPLYIKALSLQIDYSPLPGDNKCR